MTADSASDSCLIQPRREISDTDRAVVELVNKRLKLVATIKDYKAHRGMDFVDPDRERWMRKYLHRANRGPLPGCGPGRALPGDPRPDQAGGCAARGR